MNRCNLRSFSRRAMLNAALLLAVLSCSGPPEETPRQALPVRLGTYPGLATGSTHLLQVSSPWQSGEYLSVNFPEHCWGRGLPNVSHDSPTPIPSPWSFNQDSSWAVFEHTPRPGVTFRATAGVAGMSVRLAIELENASDTALTDIRTLVCLRPDRMEAFRDTSYALTWVSVAGQGRRLGEETHYQGPLPEGSPVNWALDVEGALRNLELEDLGWFRPGTGPGRIVEEQARPGLIAIHARGDQQHWIATIWHPARILFSNPGIPCIHSDPLPPDCPPGGKTRADGLILFHEGDFNSLLERVRRELGLPS